MLHEVRIKNTPRTDTIGKELLHEIHNTLSITSITNIETVKIYRLEGCTQKTVDTLAHKVLAENTHQSFSINRPSPTSNIKKIEVGYKPGVMNPEIASLLKSAKDLGIDDIKAADTSYEYHFYGHATQKQLNHILDRLLINKTVQRVISHPPETLGIEGNIGNINIITLRKMNDEQLMQCSKNLALFLQLHEMRAIVDHFKLINRDPYDAELETIAQTWSEHCMHKTFKSPLMVDGQKKEPLYKRLKTTAQKYYKTDNLEVVSAFEDNAGVIAFYEDQGVMAKVETHNSPSAIEPYGGAATGSGGVFRDIMGTGKGAKVIASTNMFCFAPPTLDEGELPPGCLHPKYLLQKVVSGVRDYGNRMGVPTNNGSVHFHKDFRAKPTVIVGAYGIAPIKDCKKGAPQPGDVIFTVGGKTGRDGIHGATFSSGHMTSDTKSVHASAVQIGNPIEEKRMADALLICRDKNLIRAITDCGAGGFSSAVGEMGEKTGARVYLEKAPLKYQGLAPWEIWVSESQERMVCAIAPEHAQQFATICAEHNVQATNIGHFTDTQTLHVTHNGNTLCDLSMQFLHDGHPFNTRIAKKPNNASTAHKIPAPENLNELYCKIMAHPNICSKEPIVRQYDHGVQGTNTLAPYAGVHHNGPNDAAILMPLLGKSHGLIISHGMHPVLNRLNPYKGALWAIAESLANLVAVGGDYQQAALIDNFIWPYPDEQFLWSLDQAIEACVDAMDAFQMPFISGKDSLSSTYKWPEGKKLHIPPVLCISSFGKIANVAQTISADFKSTDSLIVLIGGLDIAAMGGSAYQEIITDTESGDVPNVQLQKLPKRFATIHKLIQQKIISSCHDISEGGIAAALAEMCFGGNVGATINLDGFGDERPDFTLFNETAGCFLAEIAPEKYNNDMFGDVPHVVLGTTKVETNINVQHNNRSIIDIACATLLKSWQQPMKEVFHS